MEEGIIHFLQSYQPAWLTWVMQAASTISSFPSYFIVVPLVAGFFFWRGKRRLALMMVLVTVGNVLNPIIKTLVERPRPFSDIAIIFGQVSGFSFPSGHALGAAIFYGFLAWLAWESRQRWLAALPVTFILLVGVSRVYLGAH